MGGWDGVVCVLGDAREGCGGLRAAAGEAVMKSSAHQRLLHYCHQSRCLPLQAGGDASCRSCDWQAPSRVQGVKTCEGTSSANRSRQSGGGEFTAARTALVAGCRTGVVFLVLAP